MAVVDYQRQRTGWLADQHGQGIAGAGQLIFQYGDGAQRAQVLGLGLLQVKFGGLAAVEQSFGDLVITLLLAGVFVGDAQACLGGAQEEIRVGDLRPHQDQHVVIVGLSREVAGIGGFDGTAEASPEIQFPAHIESGAVLPEMAVYRVGSAGLMAVDVDAVSADLLQLRVSPALRDA
ncbi:hypothetical protein D3C76_792830 [compost metagenome]